MKDVIYITLAGEDYLYFSFEIDAEEVKPLTN